MLVAVGLGAYLNPKSFNTVTPISAAASDTVYIRITEPHTVLFFDVATTSAATVTIVGNYAPYNLVWTAASTTTTFLFIHPLETVFYAKNEHITITKEGTFTKFNIYVLETYW
ncbi:MAG: hypothetical protein WBJ87_07600 [Candidatus Hydrothermia bacterium]